MSAALFERDSVTVAPVFGAKLSRRRLGPPAGGDDRPVARRGGGGGCRGRAYAVRRRPLPSACGRPVRLDPALPAGRRRSQEGHCRRRAFTCRGNALLVIGVGLLEA